MNNAWCMLSAVMCVFRVVTVKLQLYHDTWAPTKCEIMMHRFVYTYPAYFFQLFLIKGLCLLRK